MKIIKREAYLNKLIRLKGVPDIKIITGMRRTGKSELLKLYINYLKKACKNINIIYIDFNNLEYDDLKNYKFLFKYVEKKYTENVDNILIIDEVQLCNNFELAVNSFHSSQKYDIYITGPNAFLLSSDLATLFTGRFIEIPVFPFSFKEYLKYHNINNHFPEQLDKYLKDGGLPGSYLYNDENDKSTYIKDIYTTLIKRDLVDKYNITQVSLLDSLTEFLMANISNLTTANNISNIFKKEKLQSNHITVGNYIKYLCNAFMFYRVKRYDINGKKYLETNDKYYLVDLSLRYSILGKRNIDYGRAYENLVAIELLRRGYELYVGKLYDKEIDFIAIKGDSKIYIQVSDDITNKSTLERELKSLMSIKDQYPKILLANTKHDDYDIEGIIVKDIANWLLEKEK